MSPTVDELVDGVLARDRATLGRALTLVESTHADHRGRATDLLAALLPHAGGAHRVGITGVPGVGKSMFIEALGTQLTAAGRRVAVQAVDPTSTITGGSILGDKTRMQRLANDPDAFVRPSPSAGTLGGVTRTTRETLLVLEAAGFDVVLVETVGVGLLELADMIAVNKADGDNARAARTAARDYSAALRLTQPASASWTPQVVTCSGLTGEGLPELWARIEEHREALTASGEWDERRRGQQLAWMWAMVEDRLLAALHADSAVLDVLADAERRVLDGVETPSAAADRILDAFGGA